MATIQIRPKTYPKMSPAGLGIGKNDKLLYPFIFTSGVASDTLNSYGQPRLKVGDYCAVTHSGILSAGTVGKIIKVKKEEWTDIDKEGYEIEYLDGKIEPEWGYRAGVMTKDQVKEVIDYYHKKGRPQRVKAAWALTL